MREGYLGQPLSLDLVLADRVVGKFPRVRILDSAGVLVGAPIPLTDAPGAAGVYVGSWTPAATGEFTAVYDTFDDAGFTTFSMHDPAQEHIHVHALQQDLSFQKLLGHQGENVRDDVLSYDPVTQRPLSFRRRIFASSAAAAASTPGGTGEGEIVTIVGSAAHLDAVRWQTLLRTAT